MSFGWLIVLAGIAACGYIPRPVEGVPPGAPWEALPLRKWLAEDRAEPQAIAFCAPPECRPGLAVGVIHLQGREADISQAVLQNPERLAAAMRASPKPGDKGPTRVSVSPVREVDLPGFVIMLAPAKGETPPAYGAAFGRRVGEVLKLVLVIGGDEAAVIETARRVAGRELTP